LDLKRVLRDVVAQYRNGGGGGATNALASSIRMQWSGLAPTRQVSISRIPLERARLDELLEPSGLCQRERQIRDRWLVD
jgi:hypothetical protein